MMTPVQKKNWIKPSRVRNFGDFLVKFSTAEIAAYDEW